MLIVGDRPSGSTGGRSPTPGRRSSRRRGRSRSWAATPSRTDLVFVVVVLAGVELVERIAEMRARNKPIDTGGVRTLAERGRLSFVTEIDGHRYVGRPSAPAKSFDLRSGYPLVPSGRVRRTRRLSAAFRLRRGTSRNGSEGFARRSAKAVVMTGDDPLEESEDGTPLPDGGAAGADGEGSKVLEQTAEPSTTWPSTLGILERLRLPQTVRGVRHRGVRRGTRGGAEPSLPDASGVIFGHRDYRPVAEAMREDEPAAVLSGFMPTGTPHRPQARLRRDHLAPTAGRGRLRSDRRPRGPRRPRDELGGDRRARPELPPLVARTRLRPRGGDALPPVRKPGGPGPGVRTRRGGQLRSSSRSTASTARPTSHTCSRSSPRWPISSIRNSRNPSRQ